MRAFFVAGLALCVVSIGVSARQGVDRQAVDGFDAPSPAVRVSGAPGEMAIRSRECRSQPAADVRRRIVLLAAQEWAYFGYAIVDRTDVGDAPRDWQPSRGRRRVDPVEAARVAPSIGGYWAVTPDGAWIVDSQNAIWGPEAEAARWRYAWSAAFISWVMCEAGLSTAEEFQRDVAHHRYIDQAIRAAGGVSRRAAYVAFEPGVRPIAVGDLLCTARRPAYRSLAERRQQMGQGARTHCDVVVGVDESAGRVLAIGGNVRGTVGLKALPLGGSRGPSRVADAPGDRRVPTVFAHLQLRQAYAGADDVWASSPAVRALACADRQPSPARRAAAALIAVEPGDCAS